MKYLAPILIALLVITGKAGAEPTFDRNSWTTWTKQWDGDYWKAGSFGTSQYMTCVGTNGSIGGADYWAAGMGDNAAREAYDKTIWAIGARNPAYIEVWCGY